MNHNRTCYGKDKPLSDFADNSISLNYYSNMI